MGRVEEGAAVAAQEGGAGAEDGAPGGNADADGAPGGNDELHVLYEMS
jgi:hypothetical protein